MKRKKKRKNNSFNTATQMVSEKDFLINEYMTPAIAILVSCFITFAVSFYIYLHPPLERMGARDPMGIMIVSILIGICAIVILLHGLYKVKKLRRKDD